MNFSVTDTNSSRTSEAALWPSTYISPLSNSTPCIRKDRISSKSLMRLSICLWRSEERFSRNAETDLVCRLLLEKKNRQPHVVLPADLHFVPPPCSVQRAAATESYALSLHDALPILQTHHERQKQPYGRQHTYHHYRTQRPAYEKTESLPRA